MQIVEADQTRKPVPSDTRPLADRIEGFVRSYGHVTFAELLTKFPEIDGDMQMMWPYPNLVIWPGLSETAIDTLKLLLSKQRIFIWPARVRHYYMDGLVPDLPQARDVREYKRPRWLPVSFHYTPPTKADFGLREGAKR